MKIVASALALALLAGAPAWAAEPSAVLREAMETTQARKQQAVARHILLEGDAKESFDSLYAEFQEALGAVNERYADLAWRFLEKSKAPTVAEAEGMIREFRDLEVKRLDVKDAYFPRFGKILEPPQLIRLFQIENKADAILRYEAAQQIPFFE